MYARLLAFASLDRDPALCFINGCASGRADGRTTLHALGSLESRGSLFAPPQTEVYTGMLVRSPRHLQPSGRLTAPLRGACVGLRHTSVLAEASML